MKFGVALSQDAMMPAAIRQAVMVVWTWVVVVVAGAELGTVVARRD